MQLGISLALTRLGNGTGVTSLAPQLITPGKIVIAGAGQSLKDYWWKRGAGDQVILAFCLWLQTAMGFPNVRAFSVWDSGGSCSDATSSGGTNYTVKAWNFASGGSSLWDSATGAGLAPDANYWWNVYGGNGAVTGNPADNAANSPGPLARALGANLVLGLTDLIDWDQGTTNAATCASPTAATLYGTTLQALFAWFRTQTGKTTPINITPLGNDNTASSSGTQALREQQILTQQAMQYVYILGQGYDGQYAQIHNLTGATYSSSATAITIDDTSTLSVNQIVVGSGIPDNSWVTVVTDATHFTINNTTTGSLSGGVIYSLDPVHKYAGATTTVQPYDSNGNTTYNHALGFYQCANRIAVNIPRIYTHVYSTTTGFKCGPFVSSFTAQGSHNYIDLTITQDQGSTLQSGVDITATGYEWNVAVTPSGGSLTNYTPTLVAQTDATHLRLTIGTTMTGGSTVAVTNINGAFNKTSTKNYITDNATVPMALIPSTPATDPNMTVTASAGIPLNTVAPVISGAALVGSTLTSTTGTWTETPTGYSYQWQSNGSNVGTNQNTYVTVSGDNGHTITCLVTASNAVGSGSPATSNGIVASSAYVNSVQQVSITIAGGSTTGTATISAVGSQAFIVRQGQTETNSAIAYTTGVARVTLTNSTTVTATRNSSDATKTITVNCAVVDATTNLVTSVQFGTVAVAGTSGTATITSVDTTKAAVFFLGMSTTLSTNLNRVMGNVVLTNATTVTGNLGSTGTTTTLGFCVVVFAAGALQSAVQPFNATSTSSSTAETITVSSVTANNTMVAYGGTAIASSTYASMLQWGTLTNGTTYTLTRNSSSGSSHAPSITVIEFVAGVLKSNAQRGSILMDSVASNTATITAVGTTNTLVNYTGISTSATAPDEMWADITQTNGTTLTAAKNTAGSTKSTVGYEVLEFN